MPFVVKNLISRFIHPDPMIIALFIIGLVFYVFGCKWKLAHKLGVLFLAAGLLLFALVGFGVVNSDLERLEREYPPFDGGNRELCEQLRGSVVSVLGQGLNDVDLPDRFCDNDCFRQRISEGAYVMHSIPESRLLLSISGDASYERKCNAVLQYAVTYGLDSSRILLSAEARDTVEEARETIRQAGSNRVVVVTSASHMPRSMEVFKGMGCEPVPAPCDYQFFGPNSQWKWNDIHFGRRNFDRFDRWIHETVGLFYERIRK